MHPKWQNNGKRGCPEESEIELGTQPRPLNKEKHFYKLDEKSWSVLSLLNKERLDYSR